MKKLSRSAPVLATLHGAGFESRGRTLLPKLDFTWRQGERWAILGPNGSGKSLFLSLLAGEVYAPELETEYGFKGIGGRDPESRVALVSLRKQQEALEAFDSFVQMRWNSTDSECAPTLDAWLNQDSVEDVLPYE